VSHDSDAEQKEQGTEQGRQRLGESVRSHQQKDTRQLGDDGQADKADYRE
jgi:hypothetical protein